MEAPIILAIVAVIAGGGVSFFVVNALLSKKRNRIIKEAQTEAENIKKEKILQAKERFLQLKTEHESVINERNNKLSQAENRLKQKESVLGQQLSEAQRKIKENDAIKESLSVQMEVVEKRIEEYERLRRQQIEKLETIAGLSAAEARNNLVESLKAEAKTQAMSYVNEVMDEARLNATKEAKRIVILSLQRVAQEAAIENSVTVFHIDNDEVKGRIIGREGRNIRALEAATGVEIVVDDTPEAIVISGFDPVRREVAR